MNVDIYRSVSNPKKYLAVPSGSDLTALPISDGAFSEVSTPTQNTFTAGHGLIGVDVEQALADIADHGYAIIGAAAIVGIP